MIKSHFKPVYYVEYLPSLIPWPALCLFSKILFINIYWYQCTSNLYHTDTENKHTDCMFVFPTECLMSFNKA